MFVVAIDHIVQAFVATCCVDMSNDISQVIDLDRATS
jgi:hypothetical protein